MNLEPFYQKTVLSNGLRVLTAAMPSTHSVSVSLYVGAGSRYERESEAGVSHFVEHLLFKGTEKLPTAKDVAEAIDGVGGVLNGGTDREYTVYYIKVARPHMDLALDVLFQLVRHPLMDPSEMEKERQVILEELAMVADSPPQLVDLLLDSLMWPDNPLGRDVAGTNDSVKGIDREMVLNYLEQQYVPNNILISVAGNIEHDEVVAAIESALGDWKPGKPAAWLPAPSSNGTRSAVKYKTTEQAHLSLAVPGLAADPPRSPRAFVPFGGAGRRDVFSALHGAARKARARLRRPQLLRALPRRRCLQRLHGRGPEERGRGGCGRSRRNCGGFAKKARRLQS